MTVRDRWLDDIPYAVCWSGVAALRRRETARRQLQAGTALLGMAVLADSGIEHYRGQFRNLAMVVPLGVAGLLLATSAGGFARALMGSRERPPAPAHALARRGTNRPTGPARRASLAAGARGPRAIYALAVLTGLAGLGFHAYNIGKRTGGLSWQTLFYAAPVGAPAALTLAGLLGQGAERLRHGSIGDPSRGVASHIRWSPSSDRRVGRLMAALTTIGLAGTVAEATLFHFRGAFQNPAMWLPVTLPPVAAALVGASVFSSRPRLHRLARGWLKLTAALGLAGVGFHAFGVARQMGGWRNTAQNVLSGPPLPAPPSFTGLAVAGLAALTLMEPAGGRFRDDEEALR